MNDLNLAIWKLYKITKYTSAHWELSTGIMVLKECCLWNIFAKTLHPDLFQDLNMTNEVKDYYSRFYHYNLTDDEANRILQHLPPANT